MSISRTVNITCPSCGTPQDVQLYDAVNVETDPQLKDALMHNQLNRVECPDCELSFRVDLPMLYNDPARKILIHWVPETEETAREQILEEFDRSMEEMNSAMPDDIELPGVRLVLSRVELVELIFLIEAGLNQRVVEYVKYSIFTRNVEKVDPHTHRLLLNVQDSTDEELCFVVQNADTQELGTILRYGRSAYDSMCELYDENPDEFLDMFPGPCISARNLLLEDEEIA
ncbi:MAG: CpXC domain-containing protein [Pontiella sp.]|nr:CpXC domain-containing protein [Pontiella sp.]